MISIHPSINTIWSSVELTSGDTEDSEFNRRLTKICRVLQKNKLEHGIIVRPSDERPGIPIGDIVKIHQICEANLDLKFNKKRVRILCRVQSPIDISTRELPLDAIEPCKLSDYEQEKKRIEKRLSKVKVNSVYKPNYDIKYIYVTP